jgi:single-strand DNA-binding protein
MSSYNKVILMGNLTRKPEVRYLQNGTAICKFGLAVNRRFKDAAGEWKEEATFVDITFFGKRGEAFAKFHDKGKTAFIEGSLRLDQWDDKQSGEKRSKLYVVGDDWQFVGSSERAGAGVSREMAAGDDSGGGGGGGGGYGGSYGAPQGGGDAPADVDDTPF